MEYRILGPVEVIDRGRRVELGGPLERALLARLLLGAGRVLSVERLIEDLWPGEPPGSALNSVRVRISRLRKTLATGGDEGPIRTQQPGYVLTLGPEDTSDAVRFEELIEAGRTALRNGDPETAGRVLRDALALWRGPALADIGDAPFARSEAARLEEGGLGALEDRIDADLALGREAGLVGELEALCAQHPLRERLWAQRMIALYRSGRQADALAVFQELRRTLSEDLGLDPSPQLSALESQILAQAPDLLGPPRIPDVRRTAPDGLPTGVVSFLLTDIEGSTELWDSHPVAMADVLERHDKLAAGLIAAHGGHLIKSKGEGDATLSVFLRATDAVAAAVELARAFETESWRDGIELRVRMAVHTGEAHERDGDYYGPAVNRAARVRSLAQGGQILLSQVAAELVRDGLPAGAALADLGEQSLRGLARAEHVFELLTEGAESVELAPKRVAPSRPPLPDAVIAGPASQFVGRELEIERLGTLLKEVTGGLRAVFAAGEPGIGKTRLCSEFARSAYDEGAVVLYGRSDEEPLVPYQPFVEALRRWSAALSATERIAVPGADYLAPLIAELGRTARPLPPEDPEVSRYKFFEAVASALEHASLAGTVLLVLDDLHWADRPTLQLLQHVLRARATSPILVLGTYRETDLSRTRPLAEALADFRREQAFERIALHGLAEEEILALLEGAATHEVGGAGRALARALSETTEGNPFFIEQILGNLIDTGRLVLRDGRWVLDSRVEDLGIPEGVVEAIGRRLSRLSESCNKTLAAASVLGRDFEIDTLTRVVDRDPDEVLGAIEEALQVGLVRELSTRGHAACTFSHALVQQALYEELSLARKQRLHLKAASAIEVVHATDIETYATVLALHLRAAGAAADPEKAIDYSIRAMDAAARVFAFDEGIVHGEAALELMDEYGTGGAQRARLDERLGDMHFVAGVEYDRSYTHFAKALEAQTMLGDQAKVARIHVKFGRGQATYLDTGDINDALEHLRAAEQIVGPSPDPRIAGPLALGLAAASIYHLEVEAGSAAAQRGMKIGRDHGSESIWATGAAFEGWALAIMGRFDESRDLLEQAWIVADRLDNVLSAFGAAWIRCEGYWYDPHEHSRLSLLELEKPRQAQATNARRMLRLTSAGALACAGKMSEARSLVEGLPHPTMGPGMLWFADSFGEFERMLQEQRLGLRSRGHAYIEAHLAVVLGAIQWAAGGVEPARVTLRRALNSVQQGRCTANECQTHARLAVLEAEDGDVGAAAQHIERCEELLTRGNGWRGFLGFVARAKAAMAAANEGLSEAESLFTEAVGIFRQYGLPFEEADTVHLWGHVLAGIDPIRALEKYDAALEIYTSRDVGKAWIDRVLADRSRAG
ncbi:MAG: BTAD domain-containing putative transcriptional regulator [Candidatus Binatia bacterium]